MSASGILDQALDGAEKLLESVLGKTTATTPVATVAGVKITLGGVKDFVAVVKAIPTANLDAMIKNLGDLSNDADIAANVLQTLSGVGVPFTGEAADAIEVAKWVILHSQNGSMTTIDPVILEKHGVR